MHDVGKLVLLNIAADPYVELLRAKPLGDTAGDEIEKFGIAHPSVGKKCGAKWGLPNQILAAIETHHEPFESSEPLTKAVIAANYFARKWSVGFDESVSVIVDEEIEKSFASNQTDDFKNEFIEQYQAVLEVCG